MASSNGKQDPLSVLLGDRIVGYHPALAKVVGGVKTAILLDQLSYWSRRTPPERDGWFYKHVAELYDETGLSDEEQTTARNKLIELGVIEVKYKSFPRCTWYRLDWARLLEIATAGLSQSPAFPVTGKTSDCNNQSLEKSATGKTSSKKNQSPTKPVVSHRESRGLNEARIDELNTENTSENTGEEEEGPSGQNFQVLDENLIGELLDFKIFKSKLGEIDQAGWNPDQIRWLIEKCRKDDKRGTPAALFLKRIHEWKPPIPRYGYPQYNNPPETEPPDPVVVEFEKVLVLLFGGEVRQDIVDYDLYIAKDDPNQVDVVVSCTQDIWDRYFIPRFDQIIQQLQPVGVNSLSLAA
jgi:hypothetical protein